MACIFNSCNNTAGEARPLGRLEASTAAAKFATPPRVRGSSVEELSNTGDLLPGHQPHNAHPFRRPHSQRHGYQLENLRPA